MIPQPIEQSEQIKLPRHAKSKRALRKEKRARGRPRLDGERTPSGDLSRAKPENPVEVTATVVSYRQRHYGLSPEQAAHEKAETVLGRLWLCSRSFPDYSPRKFTTAMREAGERYLEWHSAAMRAIKAPMSLVRSTSTGDGGDLVTETYIERAIKAVTQYEVAKDWCGPDLALVTAVVIDNKECDVRDQHRLRARLGYLAIRMGIE